MKNLKNCGRSFIFEFDLNWLKAYVKSMFSMNTYWEKAQQIERLREYLFESDTTAKKLRIKLLAIKVKVEALKEMLANKEEDYK